MVDGRRLRRVLGHGVCWYAAGLVVRSFLARRRSGSVALGVSQYKNRRSAVARAGGGRASRGIEGRASAGVGGCVCAKEVLLEMRRF